MNIESAIDQIENFEPKDVETSIKAIQNAGKYYAELKEAENEVKALLNKNRALKARLDKSLWRFEEVIIEGTCDGEVIGDVLIKHIESASLVVSKELDISTLPDNLVRKKMELDKVALKKEFDINKLNDLDEVIKGVIVNKSVRIKFDSIK